MDKKTKKLIDNYEVACNDLAYAFAERLGFNRYDCRWVADEPGGVFEMSDYYIGMQEITAGLRLNAKWDEFSEWYDYNLRAHHVGVYFPNFENWLGLTDAERALAKARVEEAEKLFLEAISYEHDF